MELAAGCVESLLLLLGEARPDEGSAFIAEQMEKDIFDGYAPQSGVFVTASDGLPAEPPEMIAVTAQGLGGQVLAEQMQQKGFDDTAVRLSCDLSCVTR